MTAHQWAVLPLPTPAYCRAEAQCRRRTHEVRQVTHTDVSSVAPPVATRHLRRCGFLLAVRRRRKSRRPIATGRDCSAALVLPAALDRLSPSRAAETPPRRCSLCGLSVATLDAAAQVTTARKRAGGSSRQSRRPGALLSRALPPSPAGLGIPGRGRRLRGHWRLRGRCGQERSNRALRPAARCTAHASIDARIISPRKEGGSMGSARRAPSMLAVPWQSAGEVV